MVNRNADWTKMTYSLLWWEEAQTNEQGGVKKRIQEIAMKDNYMHVMVRQEVFLNCESEHKLDQNGLFTNLLWREETQTSEQDGCNF